MSERERERERERSSSLVSFYKGTNLITVSTLFPQCQTLFFWAPKSLQMVTAAMKLKDTYSLEGKL